ncbi:hypothetical protein BLNAU_13963 [Blattamonas nauphoetae]|uniref:Uncharacterized protein n=1 Tax=Blattamonas nauphoetae TaxID=2049346 RepID=A0ABQ9XIT1_9EUKA|nr:hypothetical protein BLNAU_13963 [Blattamonas nauphoetae]
MDLSAPAAVDALTQQDSIQDMMQFAAQYTIEHAQSIEWLSVSIHDLNSDQRVTLSEIDESMSLEDLRQTQNTPDGRDLSSLLVILTFSSTVLEDPRFQHSQPISDFEEVTCDKYLKKALPAIARNVIVAIDSSIVPLSQSEFPNYNKRPDEIMPLDTSKFMLKTIGSFRNFENLELPLQDVLFRPSWYSLLSHILFNSQKFVQKPDDQKTRPMTHVVTGSSGIGKSALRFPAITLALSLGAKEVCTAKADEYPLKFVRKTREESPQSTSLQPPDPHLTPLPTPVPPAKKPTMRVAHVNKPPRDVPITPTTYKYDVFISKTKADKVSDRTIFDDEDIARQEVDLRNTGEVIYTQPKEENCIKLGEVEVPSIHHFPHFLRLFVDRHDQIHNPLEGKTWHIVDDLILDSDDLESSHHYILLTAPNQTSWRHVVDAVDQSMLSLALYVLPRYTVAEEVNMLNAIPFKFEPFYERYVAGHKKIIKTLGFTPRNMQDYVEDGRELESLKKLAKKVNVSGDIFGQSICHNLIVLDSPQADPHNFTTAYASPRAEEIVAKKWRKHLKAQCVHFVDGTGVIKTTDELTSPMLLMLFQRLTNCAVRQGAQFSRMKIRGELVVREDGKSFSFPPTPTRSGVDSSGTCDTLHVFLPDMAEFQCSEENRFNEDKWGRFFVNAMEDEPFKNGHVEEKKGKFVFLPTETPNPIDVGEIAPIGSISPSEEPITDQDEQPPTQTCSPAELHFFTFHLVPHSLYNAGFESILLFFRVDSTNKIDSLGVHFMKSSIGDEEEIDEVGANAMMAWLVLLMDLYELRADQIFPHFVFVVSERVFEQFTPNTGNITSFIPLDNIVIAALTSPTGNLRDLTIEAEDTLLLDTGKRLLPNNDPMFSEDDPTLFYTRKTLAEREEDRRSASSDRHADTHPVGLQVKYPFPMMARPNARMSGNHLTFDVVRVTIVSPVEAQRLGRRLLTDSFADADQTTPLSMSVTVNLPHPLPPPCHLYRTPFCPPPRADRAPITMPPALAHLLSRVEKKPARHLVLYGLTSSGDDDIRDSMREQEQTDGQQARHGHRQGEQTTSDMADLLPDTWMDGRWIKLETDGNTCLTRATSLRPHTALEFEEPSPFLIRSDECLGQMMLPFEKVGELRERIRRSFPAIHPALLHPHPHTATAYPQPMMEQCLLVMQQELELFWQMLSLPNMTSPDFDSSFGFSFCGLLMILQKLELFIKSNVTCRHDLQLLSSQLFAKISVILLRLETVRKDRVSSFHTDRLTSIAKINVVNEMRTWHRLKDWKDTHPKIKDERQEKHRSKMEEELKALSKVVLEPVNALDEQLKNGDQTKQNKERIATKLQVHQNTIARYRNGLLHRAWTLFDFFGSLAMSLPASTLTRPMRDTPGQLNDADSNTGREADILKAVQCVSSIIANVEYHSFLRISQSWANPSLKEHKRVKCLATISRLWEYLPDSFIPVVEDLEHYAQIFEAEQLVRPFVNDETKPYKIHKERP